MQSKNQRPSTCESPPGVLAKNLENTGVTPARNVDCGKPNATSSDLNSWERKMLRFQSIFKVFPCHCPVLGLRAPPHPAWHNGRLKGKLRPLFYAFGESRASRGYEASQNYFRNPSVAE